MNRLFKTLILAVILVPVLAGTGWLSMPIAFLCGVLALVLTKCLRAEEGYRAVDWRLLGAPRPEGDAHRVRYDAAGRSVRVRTPTLAAAPEVLDAAAGWMRAVLAGKVADHVLTPPSRLVYQVSVASSGAP